jgi:hypothetical protein
LRELAKRIFDSTPSLPPRDKDLIEFDELAWRESSTLHPYNGEAHAALNAEGNGLQYYRALEALQKYCCSIAYPNALLK